MNENEAKKCPKCGLQDFKKKRVKIPDAWGTWLTALSAMAYICKNCGYIELYLEKE
jgi:predicted nucleic-acid-binding Zn-ribbon protein